MPCFFCQRNIKTIDYKDTELLRRFTAQSAKIKSRKRTGTCATHQRTLTRIIKRSRQVGLLPFTAE